ncbi:TPA: hypothetical protein PI887_000599 [Staphylococcus aureus]|nr:hypothetical protein [Staphylococcus aureus]MBU9752880.1 hypothetical protein [Staphylococcus aureus]MBU9757837.1 hypothetical protein [Staphylococcus aureus]MBU9778137.1 hypothetical protein [Staphylococcus aureus]MBU9783623.1 hypothetical protein [Staphylococcus aureus]
MFNFFNTFNKHCVQLYVCTTTIARIYLTNSKNIVVFLGKIRHDNKNVKV